VIALECEKMNNFFLHNGECKSIQIDGYFKDMKTGWYVKCDCTCKRCDEAPKKCLECPFGLVLNMNRCVPDVSITAQWAPDFSSLRVEANKPLMYYD